MSSSAPDDLLVFMGVASHDTIAVVPQFPQADQRVVADMLTTAGGGPAATAAVAAARLGMQTAVISAVGVDPAGDEVIDGLEAEGVDTSGIQRVSGAQTARSMVVISQQRNTRAIVNQPGPSIEPPGSEAAMRLLDAASWLHVDQQGWPAWRALRSRARSPRISVDAGNRIRELDLRGIDLYAPTRQALEQRFAARRDESLPTLMRRALAAGTRAVVVSDGPSGAYEMGEDHELVHVPAPLVGDIVSTLGAGDVFHGALLAGRMRESRAPESLNGVSALAYATTIATISCQEIDGRSGIPRHTDGLMKLIADQNPSIETARPYSCQL